MSMLNKKAVLLFISFLSIVQSVFAFNVFDAPASVADIVKIIPEFKDVNCQFRQEKFVPTSNITLVSGGKFKFEKNKGVTFYVMYPINTTISYSNKDFKQISNVLNAISNKSYTSLEKDFNFFFQKSKSFWIIGLVPKNNSPLHKRIKSIQIEGESSISKMIILFGDNSRSTISWY